MQASLPLDVIRRRLAAKEIEHEISYDAGLYLCNETLFLLCRSAVSLGLRRYGFVHTPLTVECAAEMGAGGTEAVSSPTFEAARLVEAAHILIGCLNDDLVQAPLPQV